jgi:hypothetical protein
MPLIEKNRVRAGSRPRDFQKVKPLPAPLGIAVNLINICANLKPFLLIDVTGPGLVISDALEAAGVKLARVRRCRDGAWREVTESSAESPQAPKP